MKNPFAFVLTLTIFVFLIRFGSSSRDNRNSKYLKLDDYPENVNKTSELNALSVYKKPEIYKNNSITQNNYTKPNETRYRAVIESKQYPLIYSNSTSLVRYHNYVDVPPARTVIARKHHHHEEEESHSYEHGSYETGLLKYY